MKRISIILILFLIAATTLFAQTKFTELKVGLLNPSNAQTGFLGSLAVGRAVDENIGLGFSLDVYRRSYTKNEEVSETQVGNVITKTERTDLDQSTTLIPLFFQLTYQGPVMPMLNVRVTGGLGYELLWNSYTNYKTKEDDTQFFSGFGWHLDAGVSYPLSRKSDIFAELLYHGGTPSRDQGKTDEGAPIHSEIDMGGLGFRIGMRIYNLGF